MTGCSKTGTINTRVIFYNATSSVATLSATWNDHALLSSALAQGQSSGSPSAPYLNAPAGTNLLTVVAGTDTLLRKNIYSKASGGTTFILYDTAMPAGRPQILQLTDDLSLPDTATIKYRLIDLSPDSNARADVWLVNGTTDSLRLDSAAGFIGPVPSATAVQAFNSIKYHGEAYTLKIKKTGTGLVMASVNGFALVARGIYSFIFSGISSGAGATGPKITVLQHEPG